MVDLNKLNTLNEVFVLKKFLTIIICFILVLSVSACKKIDQTDESILSTNTQLNNSSIIEIAQNTSTNVLENDDSTSTNSTVLDDTSKPQPPTNTTTPNHTPSKENNSNVASDTNEENSYKDIPCTVINNFGQVALSVKNSNSMLLITFPKEWKISKNSNGSTIIKNNVKIGNITASAPSPVDKSLNVFSNVITTNDVKITHTINRVANNNDSYVRILNYNYYDENKINKNITITVPYQEINSSAVYKMIIDTKKAALSTNNNMGTLKITDNRNKILILGNSFIATSAIGNILQQMCGDKIVVEAHSRGYANVKTYTEDSKTMQNILNGNYSAVFICGLYNYEAVAEIPKMINACTASDTKIAIFPAHNENQGCIDNAKSLYSDTLFIDWKSEINHFIDIGIHVSEFCIPDSHNHSTPLAGYIGAHMIYRAIFNEIPPQVDYFDVTPSQIKLLGEYATTGSISLIDQSLSFVVE